VSNDLINLGATRKALTNTAIDALRPGQELKDDRVPGLSVRANATGKSFMLYYRHMGQPRRPKIGDCKVLSLSDARAIAKAMLGRVSAGEDPSGQRQRERNDPTLDDLWARCEIEHWNRNKPWDKEAKRIYDHDIKPIMGSTRVRAVAIEDAKKVRDRLTDKPIQANRAIAVLSKMLRLAETFGPEGQRWRALGSNPCQHVPRFPAKSRKRFAKPVEIQALPAALDKYIEISPSAVAFIYVMLFSGARPSEILRAAPDQVERIERDGKPYGVLRIPDGKTGHRDVFLPPQAMAAIDRLPAKRTSLVGRTTVPKVIWHKIRKEIGADGLWARDLRRTWATVGLSNGVAKGALGALMGHADPKTTDIYAKLIEDTAHDTSALIADRMEAMLTSSSP
jgi:integrase